MELEPGYQLGPNALQRIYVQSQGGAEVPLSQIASHQGQFPSATLSFNLAPGVSVDGQWRQRGMEGAMLGGVPLMLGTGTGSELRQPLGYTIVGGLLVSQLLTLFTTPVVYVYMGKLSGLRSRNRHKQESSADRTQGVSSHG